MATAVIYTPLGNARITANEQGVSAIRITEDRLEEDGTANNHIQAATTQLQEYFEGSRKSFDLSLAPTGTPFQQKVWNALQTIPFGKTCSYLEITKTLGDPKAIRAVASANGKNPLWIVIPCHRIIGSDGSLVGYAGGLHRKKWLLNHESQHPQQSLF